uniref:hypothetical protein n=1 Tax=Crenothrix polyspora TaxID=360316 RepID=UPI001C4FECE1
MYVFISPFEKGGYEGDLFKKSPLTPLFQRGGLNDYVWFTVSLNIMDMNSTDKRKYNALIKTG